MELGAALGVAAVATLVGLPLLLLALLGLLLFVQMARPSRNQITPRHIPFTFDVVKGRQTATIDGDFVIFLIGASFNKVTHIRDWATALIHGGMTDMLKDLAADPESGFLGAQQYLGNPLLIVQYWRSMDDLLRFAKNPKARHLPAMRMYSKAFARSPTNLAGGGIYHEAYKVRSGEWEAVYVNCVPVGLGRFSGLKPATGRMATAAGRLGKVAGSSDPAPELEV